MILHVDMDAFYASVEQRDRPELRGKPVIVGGSAQSRGVVSAASYEARKFGVHSAMPTAVAHRLCPQAVFLPVRMEHYAQVSGQIRNILEEFTPLVEPISLDEAFLDVCGCERLFGSTVEIAHKIKERIRGEIRLIASVGAGPNKFVAKLASDLGKPDGLIIVQSDQLAGFLEPLPIGRIWGVGAKAESRLHSLGIHTIGQLREVPADILVEHFGDMGRHFHQLALGIDDRTVVPDADAKSISTETTFPRDISEKSILRSWLLELADQVAARLRRGGIRARTIEIKVRSRDFQTHTRSMTLPESTNITQTIWQAAADLFDHRIPLSVMPARLLGVAATSLERDTTVQQRLFDEPDLAKQRRADEASDKIRERFGSDSLRRAGVLTRPEDKSRKK